MTLWATTIVSSKGQVVIPRHLREKHRLTSGVRLQITETDEGLVPSPIKRARSTTRQSGWRVLRGSAKGTARVFGGMHFRHSAMNGAQLGRKVAKNLVDNFFRPTGARARHHATGLQRPMATR